MASENDDDQPESKLGSLGALERLANIDRRLISLEDRIDHLADAVSAAGPTGAAGAGADVDLTPVLDAIDALQPSATLDLTPLLSAIEALDRPTTALDVTPLLAALDEFKAEVDEASTTTERRLAELAATSESLASAIADGPARDSGVTDLGPVLDAITELRTETGDRVAREVDSLRNELSVALSSIDGSDDVAAVIDAMADLRAPAIDTSAVLEAIERHRPAVDLAPVLAALDELRAPAPELRAIHDDIRRLLDAPTDDDSRILEEVADMRRLATELAETIQNQRRDHIADTNTLLDAITAPTVDLSPVLDAIEGLQPPVAPDLDTVLTAIADVRTATDAAIAGRMSELRAAIDAIAEAGDDPALEVVVESVGLVREQVADLHQALAASRTELRDGLAAATPDLTPVLAALTQLAERDIDLTPVTAAVTEQRAELRVAISGLLDAMAVLVEREPDYGPILDGIEAIPATVGGLLPDLTIIQQALVMIRDEVRAHALDPEPLLAAIEASRVSLAPVLGAITGLRTVLEEEQHRVVAMTEQMADVSALVRSSEQHMTFLRDQVTDGQVDLGPVLGAIADGRADVTAVLHAVESLGPDLAPMLEQVRSISDGLGDIDERLTATQATVDGLAASASAGREADTTLMQALAHAADQLRDIRTGVASVLEATVKIGETTSSVADGLATTSDSIARSNATLTQAITETVPDLSPVLDAIGNTVVALGATTEQLSSHIDDANRQLSEMVSGAMADAVPDLTPMLQTLRSTNADIATLVTSISTMTDATDAVRSDVELTRRALAEAIVDAAPDLSPILDAIAETGPDLAPVQEAIRSTHLDVGTVLEALADARDQLAQTESDLAERIAETRSDLEPIAAAIEATRAPLTDIEAALETMGGRVDQSATDMIEQIQMRRAETSAQLRSLADRLDQGLGTLASAAELEAVQSRLGDLEATVTRLVTDSLRESESRISRRVQTSTEAMRSSLATHRAQSDSIAAQLSALSAAMVVSAEQPDQLRRELDRTLEGLAERMGSAMRGLREDIQDAAAARSLGSGSPSEPIVIED